MYCILFPTGKRHGYHPATSFHAKFLHEKRCPLNIPHPSGHLGRSPLMAWQPLQQPCLQPTPRFPTCFFPWLYRSNMLNSRGFWGKCLELLQGFLGHISGMISTEKLWFHKSDTHVILTQHGWWCTDETPTSSRLRSPEVPSCDWGYGCFDSSGKACMKLSEKVQTTYSYTQIQKCTYQSYELWVSDWCLAHEFWRSPTKTLSLGPQGSSWKSKGSQIQSGRPGGARCAKDACRNLGKHGAHHCWYCRWLASRGRKMRRTSNLVARGLAFWQHFCITKSHLGHLRVDLPPCLTHFSVPLEFRMLLNEMICWADLSRLLFEGLHSEHRTESETCSNDLGTPWLEQV